MAGLEIKPTQTYHERATALEAALSVCLAEPDKRAVHKLRTDARRVEAQVALLKRVRGLPRFQAEAATLLRQTRKVRRAAGKVRDLDVQHKMIKEQGVSALEGEDDQATLQKQIDDLIAAGEDRRVHAAGKLISVLTRRQVKLAGALEALDRKLEPAAERTLAVTELVSLVERGYRSTPALRRQRPDDEDLHDIRKAAKRARYQAETAPESAAAKAAAAGYEELQEAGGTWHDWHDLALAAADAFGRRHRITTAFAARRDAYLEAYRRLLAETVPTPSGRARGAKGAATSVAGAARPASRRGRRVEAPGRAPEAQGLSSQETP